MKPALAIYRAILHEIRLQKLHNPIRTDLTTYISREFKKHTVTEEKFCRANESALFDAKTYLEMLRSTRLHRALAAHYKGKGERTIEESANLVGLTSDYTNSPKNHDLVS
ncbi:hypothetical protein BV898_10875 [Hypsibius exemplaris]|uniref:Protein FMC1 homolog n=1 Tax=Hypsibius exemplaris TaxID=2072580 RepID=A0A1W0WID4_HYPEX|nr:hypothetical protein BV898_10875 [Hypsibius exemplaris]